jgi:hypothetical protein
VPREPPVRFRARAAREKELATFTHAMTSRTPTAPSRIHSIAPALPTVSACSGVTRADTRTEVDAWLFHSIAAAIVASSACACAIVAPGFSLAIALR